MIPGSELEIASSEGPSPLPDSPGQAAEPAALITEVNKAKAPRLGRSRRRQPARTNAEEHTPTDDAEASLNSTHRARINAEHRASVKRAHAAIEHARRAGDLLKEVKSRLPHGRFKAWIAEHCEFSYRSAAAYMRVAEHWDELARSDDGKVQPAALLTLSQALGHIAESRPKPKGAAGRAVEIEHLQERVSTTLEDGLVGADDEGEPGCDPPGDDLINRSTAIADEDDLVAGESSDPVPSAEEDVDVVEDDRGIQAAGSVAVAALAEAPSRPAAVAPGLRPVGSTPTPGWPGLDAEDGQAVGEVAGAIRTCLSEMRSRLRPTSEDPRRTARLWAALGPMRGHVSELLRSDSSNRWSDCELCSGSGRSASGRPCERCRATGVVAVAD